MIKIEEKLTRFGLNKREIQVYLAVLKASECSIGAIEKSTNLHRQIIYNAAESLAEKNLLTVVKQGGRRRFIAADPESFEQLALKQLEDSRELSKELSKFKSDVGFSGDAKLYKGHKEIQRYYLDATSNQPLKSVVDIIGVESKRFFEIFPKDSMALNLLEQRRIERRVRWRILLSGSAEEESSLNRGRTLLDFRLINKNIVVPIDLMIWRDHVGILMYGEPPSVLDIPGDKAARGFRKYFSLLWENGKEIILKE